MTQGEMPPWPRLPLWFVAAVALAFLILGILMFGRDWRREMDYLGELHLWRGEALISSLEVLSRVRPHEPWAATGLQNFWDSLADEEEILFLALTDGDGRLLGWAGREPPEQEIFGDARAERPGLKADRPDLELFRPQYRRAPGRKVGLVHRHFRPWTRHRRHHMMMEGGGEGGRPPLIQAWVGFDLRASDKLGADRARSAALSAGLFCLTGLAVMLALFAGYNVRLTRRLYQEVKAELAVKERLAALGHLAAGLAHEIRNPLGAIDGLCRHLMNRLPAEDREALEVMLTSVGRLNRAVTDFLDYARPLEIETAPLELGGLAKRTAALVAHDAKAGAVELSLDLEEVWIAGDEPLLAQALLNLYLNAIEAARSAFGAGPGRLEVSLRKADRRASLAFRDNGPGFSPEQLARPFEPYFTTKAEGTGLGLALVEKAVRAHPGGEVTLESPPEGGALVTLTFNLAPPDRNRTKEMGA